MLQRLKLERLEEEKKTIHAVSDNSLVARTPSLRRLNNGAYIGFLCQVMVCQSNGNKRRGRHARTEKPGR